MRVLHCVAVVAAVGSFCSSAFAKESGFELGGRLGYGIPWGRLGDPDDGQEVDDDDALDVGEWVSGQIPFQFDAGYRINPQLFVGGYFSYGIGFVGDVCDQDTDVGGERDCSASNVRLGGQLTYHFTPVTEGNAGWIGGGIGFEWLNFKQEASFTVLDTSYDVSQEIQFTGFELLNVQGGYDIVVSDAFRLGPYGMLTLAQYSDVDFESTVQGESESDSEEIENKAMHGWVMLGVKGTFGPL